jgi:DNA-binding Lrp family transcriptional regulator
MSEMNTSPSKIDFWKLLHAFENEVRVEIIKLLLQFEWRSLSDIAKKLEDDYDRKMTLPGVLKHMRELEKVGIVRHESGIYSERPDARKTIYVLEGKERVQKIIELLEKNVASILNAGIVFHETAGIARKLQRIGRKTTTEENESLKRLIAKCESEEIGAFLTEDEKKKLKLWKMMIAMEEH